MGAATRKRGRPPRRTPPVPRRPESTRAVPTFEAVVQAAARVLNEHGIEGLTTNRVAEVAGVSIGSLYQYFPNKEAIVAALIEHYHQRIVAVLGPAMEEGTSIEDICRRGIAGLLPLVSDRVIFAHLRALRTAAGANELIARQLDEMVERGATALMRLGLASDDDAHDIAYVVIQSGEGLMNALARSADVDIIRVSMIYLDFIKRYFAARVTSRAEG